MPRVSPSLLNFPEFSEFRRVSLSLPDRPRVSLSFLKFRQIFLSFPSFFRFSLRVLKFLRVSSSFSNIPLDFLRFSVFPSFPEFPRVSLSFLEFACVSSIFFKISLNSQCPRNSMRVFFEFPPVFRDSPSFLKFFQDSPRFP
jgi:hypothetical protein